jgi:hypothetical protein
LQNALPDLKNPELSILPLAPDPAWNDFEPMAFRTLKNRLEGILIKKVKLILIPDAKYVVPESLKGISANRKPNVSIKIKAFPKMVLTHGQISEDTFPKAYDRCQV